MVPPEARLIDFVQAVPVCLEPVDLRQVIDQLQQQPVDRLVVLNQARQPIGVLPVPKLFAYLNRPASEAQGDDAALVEPLRCAMADLPLEEWLSSLDAGTAELPLVGLVDGDGTFLGLLDHVRLLLVCCQPWLELEGGAAQVDAESKSALPPPRSLTELSQQLLNQRERQREQLQSYQDHVVHSQQLLEQRNRLIARLRSYQDGFAQLRVASAPTVASMQLAPLLELVERLPLPLMLQTQNGGVIAQNRLWQQQVGELLDPNWLWQEAATLLESTSSTHPTLATEPNPPASGLRLAGRTRTDPDDGAIATDVEEGDAALPPAFCQIGANTDTCVCTCPLKNGQEQVLKFVKVPIGTLKTDAIATPFRLANLLVESGEPLSVPEGPIDSNTLWLVLAQDLTEQLQLAHELTAKNADLVQLNRLKDEFLACISHELRTPLTAVLGLSSLLKDQTLGQLNQRQVHYAQLIYQSGRHLMSVVNDILDLTRIETGQLELVPEPVELKTVCNRALEQAKQIRLLEDKSAEETSLPAFQLELEPGIGTIVADELRLRQMLVHLLSNALKFTEADQHIGLKINRWGGWIAFTVWDKGIGIAADKQHLVFQKFQQLENPLTRRFEGTGLGLVLTRRLARLHGGDVTFLSKEGQGSQFTILLPPSPPGAPVGDPSVPGYPGGRVPVQRRELDRFAHAFGAEASPLNDPNQFLRRGSRLVLIVEAAPQFIEALSEQLSSLSYRVVIARSGTEALEKARRLQPCIVFLNPVLPMLSGWDVLTLLKSGAETRSIPVVVTATQVDEDQAQHSHADGLINLPVQPKALRQSLRRLVTDAHPPEPPTVVDRLTVLRLSPGSSAEQSLPTADLNQLLHSHHYRVLEADDLEQAELLARVWKPNVVLLDRTPSNPTEYFQQFSQHMFLASLPLVTLDQETAQAANQVLGLLVFPCLAALDPKGSGETGALLQVLQVAAGYTWRPTILALDPALLPDAPTPASPSLPDEATGISFSASPLHETEWLQALTQYLQTAGLRCVVGHSWQEVLRQVQSQSVNLVLVCWTESHPDPVTLQRLAVFEQVTPKRPLLVLDHRSIAPSQADLPPILRQIATQVLPPTLPMEELLQHIHQVLQQSD